MDLQHVTCVLRTTSQQRITLAIHSSPHAKPNQIVRLAFLSDTDLEEWVIITKLLTSHIDIY